MSGIQGWAPPMASLSTQDDRGLERVLSVGERPNAPTKRMCDRMGRSFYVWGNDPILSPQVVGISSGPKSTLCVVYMKRPTSPSCRPVPPSHAAVTLMAIEIPIADVTRNA
jgi:hypothetical protein